MVKRKGLGKGKGKGYKNIQGRDPKIHSDSARGRKQPQRIINLKRVAYGDPRTPIDLREYQMGRGLPVGTIKEFEDYFKNSRILGFKILFISSSVSFGFIKCSKT